MLQFQVKELDICRISKLLCKYTIKASITNDVITLDGDISDELLAQLFNEVTVCKVQNFASTTSPIVQNNSTIFKTSEPKSTQIEDNSSSKLHISNSKPAPEAIQNYNLIYSKVKRGEVYLCDFGTPCGSEMGYLRYAIIIQNNSGNRFSSTTIVLPCTSKEKKPMPTHHKFTFSYENMLDFIPERIRAAPYNTALAEQIRTVDKTRLRKYLGTMTPEFMDNLQKIIDCSLGLKKIKSEDVATNNFVATPTPPNVPKTFTEVQTDILALVNIEELSKIIKSTISTESKIEKILQLFGFDMCKNGVAYLFKAILFSQKSTYFNLETLCENISKTEANIATNEIKRLIVARVKERFNLKKSPTIDFIRLVNSLLTLKGGVLK